LVVRCIHYRRFVNFLPGWHSQFTDRPQWRFLDIQLSSPKDVSVLAMVGGDERVRDAFVASVKITLAVGRMGSRRVLFVFSLG